MKTEEINQLITNVPILISYLSYGFLFLTSYHWIRFKDNQGIDNLLIKSVITTYILKNIYTYILFITNFTLSNEVIEIIILNIVSAVIGFISGKIISTEWFNSLLYFLRCPRTTNDNIWSDVIKSYTWLRLYGEDGSSYLGQCKYAESFTNHPIIVLANYQRIDKDNEIEIDLSQDSDRCIMLNTEEFKKIEIIYQNNEENKIKNKIARLKNIFTNR